MSQTFVHDFTIYKIPLKIHKKKQKNPLKRNIEIHQQHQNRIRDNFIKKKPKIQKKQ